MVVNLNRQSTSLLYLLCNRNIFKCYIRQYHGKQQKVISKNNDLAQVSILFTCFYIECQKRLIL